MTTYVTTFEVTGGVRFPVDMLRYDSCHPCSGEDAAYMDRALDRGILASERAAHPIKLAHVGTNRYWTPTSERWKSFMWRVDEDSVQTSKYG
jgi:hypothetical protein